MAPQELRISGSAHVLCLGNRPWPPSDGDLKRAVKLIQTSQPVRDPSYPEVEGLPNTYDTFHLTGDGLTSDKREHALTAARHYHSNQKAHFLGFQMNQNLQYSKDFSTYLDTSLNNVGDPFSTGNLTINSKFMERAVLDYFALLWNARCPHNSTDTESYWGFLLTMGCTEGNLYGMWNARDYLSGKMVMNDTSVKRKVNSQRTSYDGATNHNSPLRLKYNQAKCPDDNPNAYTPIAFYSQDTNYSFAKAMTMLAIRTFYEVGHEMYRDECPLEDYHGQDWPEEVPSEESGAIDVDALTTLVEFFAKRGYPIIVCFNYGTTYKGAYDDVEAAGKKLMPILKQHNLFERKVSCNSEDENQFDCRTGYWFHVDGALGAAYMPFIEMAYNAKLTDNRGPNFDFRLPYVHSIAVSGHKWLGVPMPCGVYMTKVKYRMSPPDNPEYTGTPDTTFACSRNGISPMILWDNIARHSYSDYVKKALRLEAMTQYTVRRLRDLEKKLATDLLVARTPLALTVRFKETNKKIITKFSLSTKVLHGIRYCHVYIMDHVTTHLIEEFIRDLQQDGAFPHQDYIKSVGQPHIRRSTP